MRRIVCSEQANTVGDLPGVQAMALIETGAGSKVKSEYLVGDVSCACLRARTDVFTVGIPCILVLRWYAQARYPYSEGLDTTHAPEDAESRVKTRAAAGALA